MPTTDGEKPNGQIVNSVFQVTADPPKIAISLNKNNLTHSYVEKSKIFSISVLDQETPMTFIGLFGFRCGRDVDKFEKTAHKMREKCPIVTDNTLAVMLCKVSASMDLGTHTLFIGEVIGSELIKEGTPLTYDYYHKVKKGKTQKYATTYNEG
ncbi:MAG: flavin reductase family protein [Elusimicrobia bacterium]|nr:flavin reductase family protein [Elusimicrobiota bacterium]